MEVCQKKDTTKNVNQEHYPIHNIQSSVIRSTEEILQMYSPLDLEKSDLVIAMKFDQSLKLNKDALNVLTGGINADKYSNNKTELEKIRKTMQENITLLEERLNIYKRSIRKESEEINYSTIKGYFKDPKTADSVIDKITIFYEDILNDTTYGKAICSIMIALGKSQCMEDSPFFNKYVELCVSEILCVKGNIEGHIEYNMPGLEALIAVQESLLILIQILWWVTNNNGLTKL